MKKLTKLLSIFLIAGAVGTGVAGVAGCNKGGGNSGGGGGNEGVHHTNEHQLHYESKDGNKHTITCTVDGCDYTATEGDHEYDGEDDATCNRCTYEREIGGGGGEEGVHHTNEHQLKYESKDGNKHTITCTVDGCDYTATEGDHEYDGEDDATCNRCTYERELGGGEETKTLYEELVEKSIYHNEFGTAADRLTDYVKEYGIATNVYTDFAPRTSNPTMIATRETHYTKVEEGAASLVNPGDGTTYLVADFGALKANTDVEFYAEVKLSSTAKSGWTFMQFVGNSGSKTNNEVFGLRTNKPSGSDATNGVEYRLDGGSVTAPTERLVVPAIMKIYFKYTAADKKVYVNINDTDIFGADGLTTTITSLQGVRFASVDGGTETMTVDNVVVCGTTEEVATHKTNLTTKLETLNGTYATGYTKNAENIAAAYNAATSAIEAATTLDEVGAAYITAVNTMKSYLSDEEITAKCTAAVTALTTAYPSGNYTIAIAEGDDTKYNNQSDYSIKLGEETEKINACTTQSAIDEALEAAKTVLGAIKNNAAMLADKKTEAKATLSTYGDLEQVGDNDHDGAVSRIETARTEVGGIDEATTIDGVNTALKAKTDEIDGYIANSNLGAEALKEALLESLASAGTTATGKIKNSALQTAVSDIVTAGTTAINDAEDDEIQSVYDLAEAKIDAIVEVDKYASDLAKEYYSSAAKAEFVLTEAQITAIKDATADTLAGKVTAAKTALDAEEKATAALAADLAARDDFNDTVTVNLENKMDFFSIVGTDETKNTGNKTGTTLTQKDHLHRGDPFALK